MRAPGSSDLLPAIDKYQTARSVRLMPASMTTLPRMKRANWFCAIALPIVVAYGCRSSSHSQQSAASTLASPPVGASLDDVDARNRADISAQLGRPVAPGPA